MNKIIKVNSKTFWKELMARKSFKVAINSKEISHPNHGWLGKTPVFIDNTVSVGELKYEYSSNRS